MLQLPILIKASPLPHQSSVYKDAHYSEDNSDLEQVLKAAELLSSSPFCLNQSEHIVCDIQNFFNW
jgi:hypothetical protein